MSKVNHKWVFRIETSLNVGWKKVEMLIEYVYEEDVRKSVEILESMGVKRIDRFEYVRR